MTLEYVKLLIAAQISAALIQRYGEFDPKNCLNMAQQLIDANKPKEVKEQEFPLHDPMYT